ncbi:outer membrane beta-barrel protein [Planctomycetota bacterium]
MVHRIGFIALLALSTTSLVFGVQESPTSKRGDWTLTFGGSGASNKDFNSNGLSLNAGLGYFVTDNAAVVLRQEVNVTDTKNDQAWSGSTRVAGDYHFGKGTFRPYLGANIGYLYGDGVKEQFIAGPELGLKAFLTPKAFVYVNAEYQFLFDNSNQIDDNYRDGRFVYSLGLGFKW